MEIEEVIRYVLVSYKIIKRYEEIRVSNEFKESEHPRDKDGKFTSSGKAGESETTSSEINAKIEKLSNIDWNKDNILPNLNKETLKKYGFKDKKIRLKKDIIDRNNNEHSDITKEAAIRILGNALYKPESILKANKEKSSYYHFITQTNDEYSDLVLVDVSETEEYYDIIHYFVVRNKSRRRLERLDKNIKENKR